MSVDFQLPLEPYLERNASWNPKRTVARLSIFDTPLNLIHPNPSGITIIQSEDSNAPPDVDSDSLRNGGLTCRACALAFNSVAEQRLHFKSSLHTTNLRRRLQGLQPAVTAAITDDVENLKLNDSKDSGENENDSGDSADEAGPAENDVVESEYSSVCAPTSGNGAEGEFSRSISGTEGPVLTFRPDSSSIQHTTVAQNITGNPKWDRLATSLADGSTEFCYMEELPDNSYKFSFSSHPASNNFSTLSRFGILRMLNGEGEKIPFDHFLFEHHLHAKLTKIKVFGQFRLWKTLYCWRHTVRERKCYRAVCLFGCCATILSQCFIGFIFYCRHWH
jgi:hypothetical protein